MATGIKPLTELISDIQTELNLHIDPNKFRTAIISDMHDQLDPIVDIIDKFIASNPTTKTELYEFLNKYNPRCLGAYRAWDNQNQNYTIPYIILMIIQDEKGLSDKDFAPYFTANLTRLNDMT